MGYAANRRQELNISSNSILSYAEKRRRELQAQTPMAKQTDITSSDTVREETRQRKQGKPIQPVTSKVNPPKYQTTLSPVIMPGTIPYQIQQGAQDVATGFIQGATTVPNTVYGLVKGAVQNKGDVLAGVKEAGKSAYYTSPAGQGKGTPTQSMAEAFGIDSNKYPLLYGAINGASDAIAPGEIIKLLKEGRSLAEVSRLVETSVKKVEAKTAKKAAVKPATMPPESIATPVEAPKPEVNIQTPPTSNKAKQVKVTQYKSPNVVNLQAYGDVQIIDQKNGLVKFQTRNGKPVTIDENDFELLKTGNKPQYTQKISVSTPMKGSEAKKEPIKPPTSSTVVNTQLKVVERYKRNYESELTQLEKGIQDGDTILRIQQVKDKIAEMDNRINTLTDKTAPNKLIDTAKESGQYTESVTQNIQGEHNIRSTTELSKQAEEIINKTPEKAISMAKSKEMATDLSNEIAHQLIQKANAEGRFNDAIDLIEITAKKATETGRAEQALSLWSKLSPEGMLKYAQKVINQANQKFAKANAREYMQIVQEYKKLGINLQLFATPGKRADLSKVLRLTADDAKYINDQMVKIGQMAEGRARTVEIAKTLDYISGKIPPTLSSKISTLQTMAQLLNPKTAIRNTVGNMGFAILRNVAKTIGTPIDMLVSAVTKERTTALPSLVTQAKGFAKGWKLGLEDALNGIDTSGLEFQFDLKQNRTFRDGFFGALEKAMGIELKATDRAFYQSAFEDSLREQMKLAKVKQPTDLMIEKAHLEGLYSTFQDKNMVSNAFTGIKRALNGGKEFGLGDVLLKYPKTPANLLARGVEFSPLGVIKSLCELVRPIAGKTFNQKAFVDSLSRAAVGSGLAYGAYSLYNLGILSGKRPKDKDAAALQQEVGQGAFTLNTSALKRWIFSGFNADKAKPQEGDNLINYDWFQPASSTVAMGANIASQLQDKKRVNPLDILGAAMTSIEAGVQTLADQPVVQGLAKAFRGYDIVSSMTDALKGIPASFMPSLINQAKQFVDNTSRDTYNYKLTGLAGIDQSIALVMNKIPVLSNLLPERVTTTGNVQQTYKAGMGNFITRLLNVTLNPSFPSKYKADKGIQLVLDLYKNTGETKQFPQTTPKYMTINGKKFAFTPDEQKQLQITVGKETVKQLNELAKDKGFNKLTDAEKVEEIASMLSSIGDYGKGVILQKYSNQQIESRLK